MPIYGQLALLHYASGDYPAALEAAQRCYAAAVQRDGEGAPSTLPHAVRYGVMLLGESTALLLHYLTVVSMLRLNHYVSLRAALLQWQCLLQLSCARSALPISSISQIN